MPERRARPLATVARRLVLVAVSALLPTSAAVAQADAPLEERVNRAMATGREAVLEFLDGGPLGIGLRDRDPGVVALLCLAALHCGVPAAEPRLARALARLREAQGLETYALSLRLMVVGEDVTWPDRQAFAARDLGLLLGHRDRAGAFGYRPNEDDADMSNTQFAAFGLRAAAGLGLRVRRKDWDRLRRATVECQFRDGGFGYGMRPGGGLVPTLSMTCAGLAVLEVCAEAVGHRGESRKAVRKAVEYLEERSDRIGSADERFTVYMHYSLLRAALLAGLERIGEVDWYRAGASMICGLQNRRGGWSNPEHGYYKQDEGVLGNPTQTALALLFLRRRLPVTQARTYAVHELPEDAGEAAVATAIELVLEGGQERRLDVLKALRSELAVRREAGFRALCGLRAAKPEAERGMGYRPDRPPARNEEALARIGAWLETLDDGG